MTKVLILGGGGMLGHKAYQVLSKEFDTYVTFRNFDDRLKHTGIFDEKKVINGVDAFEIESVKRILSETKPGIVINCIGVIKQLKESQDRKLSIYINSLFPNLLAEVCADINSKLIHISTDCVYSGKKGNYTEEDLSDAEDIYGKTKFLGEVNYGNSLTIRTSIIGHELFTHFSLADWFISQNNKSVKGFVNAVYTGLPSVILSREIKRIIKSFPGLKGLYNVSSGKINKYELLKLIKNVYELNVEIIPFEDFCCDRSLNSEKYRNKTGFKPMSWEVMTEEMHKDYLENNYSKK